MYRMLVSQQQLDLLRMFFMTFRTIDRTQKTPFDRPVRFLHQGGTGLSLLERRPQNVFNHKHGGSVGGVVSTLSYFTLHDP